MQPGLREGEARGRKLVWGVTPLPPVIQGCHAAHVALLVLPHGDGPHLGLLALAQGHVHVLPWLVLLKAIHKTASRWQRREIVECLVG